MRTTVVSILLVLTATAACKKGDDSTSADPAAKPTEPKPAAAAAPAWKKIPSIGIEVQVPADTDVQDNSKQAGFPSSTMYFTDGTPTLFIMGAKDPSESMAIAKDHDAAKAQVQKEMNGFKTFTKDEKTADGFVLAYTGTSLGEDKALYGVTRRSVVAGLTLDCTTNAPTEAEIAKAIEICKTIRAAK